MLGKNIDVEFSIFDYINQLGYFESSISHRKTMTAISYLIEDITRLDHARNTIYVGFQCWSKFLSQLRRYRDMARHAHHIYVFGVPDCDVPPIDNVTYIPLESFFTLSKEWFVVSSGRHFRTAISAKELSKFNDADDKRLFRGIWVHNPKVVGHLVDHLDKAISESIHINKRLNISSETHKFLKVNINARFRRIIQNSAHPQQVQELSDHTRLIRTVN